MSSWWRSARPVSLPIVAGLVGWSAWLIYESISLSQSGQRAVGGCIGIEYASSRGRLSRGWVFRIAYRDASGNLQRATGRRGPGWPYLFVGDRIPIVYDPSNPAVCYPDSFAALWGVTLFVTSVAALGVIYVVIDHFRPDP
jgi:hypothetical protein